MPSSVTLAEVKLFLQVDHDHEDTLIQSLINSAIEAVEAETGLALSVHTGAYVEGDGLDTPKPLQPYTVANGAYTTAVTPKLEALKPAVYLWVQGLYNTDPKTIELSLDASRRVSRLHRVDWGF